MLRWKQNALSVVASGAGGHRVRRHVSRRAASGVEERLPLRTALRCNHRIHARVVALDHRNKWIGMDRVHVRLKRAVRNHEALLPVGWRPLLGRMQLTTKPTHVRLKRIVVAMNILADIDAAGRQMGQGLL